MSEKRKEANYGFGSNFKSEEVRNLDMLINAINNTKDADTTRALLQAFYNYYYVKQIYIELPDNEFIKKIKDFDSNGKDPFDLIQDPIIREKAREIIPNEVEIKTSKNLSELISRVYEIGNIESSKGTYTPEDIQNIIIALYETSIRRRNIGYDLDYNQFELLPRTYGIREKALYLIMLQSSISIIVDKSYAKLEEGDILLGPHSVYITYGDEFYKFKKEADEFVKNFTDRRTRAEKLNDFVYNKMKYDLEWMINEPFITISDAIKELRGICLEQAALLYMLLVSEGYDVYYVGGTLLDGGTIEGHVWIKLYMDGENYLVDPTNKVFYLYDYFISKGIYKEGKNIIGKTLSQIRRT